MSEGGGINRARIGVNRARIGVNTVKIGVNRARIGVNTIKIGVNTVKIGLHPGGDDRNGAVGGDPRRAGAYHPPHTRRLYPPSR